MSAEKRRSSPRNSPASKKAQTKGRVDDGPQYTLYFAKQTRAHGTKWFLEELGVSYKVHELDFSKKEHQTDEYRKIHPHCQVPALTDHSTGVTMYESAAIIMYLAEKHDMFQAPFDSPERPLYLQWCCYGNGTIEDALMKLSMNGPTVADRSEKAYNEGKKRWDEAANVLINALKGKVRRLL